jgi:hypothetical protein
MAVDAAEFTGVGGLLNTKALWPRVSTTEIGKKFAAWLADAETKVADFEAETQDAATRAWVKYRAWDDVYQIRLGNPASIAVDGRGSSGYTQGQIDAAKAERDAALLAFEAIEVEQVDAGVPGIPRGSRSVPIQFVW